jgi:tetratricopeptide (TPR) repeat protein
MLVLYGVALTAEGRTEEASGAFARAENFSESREEFLLARSMAYLRIGEGRLAQADASEIVAANPQSAVGYYHLGLAYQALQDPRAALDAYEKGSAAAEILGDSRMMASIRINMGMVMQSMQSIPMVSPTREN